MVIHAEMEHCPAILRLDIRNHSISAQAPAFRFGQGRQHALFKS
jgi:hypothetical protein